MPDEGLVAIIKQIINRFNETEARFERSFQPAGVPAPVFMLAENGRSLFDRVSVGRGKNSERFLAADFPR